MKNIDRTSPQAAFRLFMLLTGLLLFQPLFATHMSGGEIEYTCIGPRKWIVKLTVYRYCDNGAATLCTSFNCPQAITATPSPSIAQGGLNPDGCSANPSSVSATLQLQSVSDVETADVTLCGPAAKNGCNNMGQVAPGAFTPSVEKYVFAGELNMNLPSLGNACPYWDIGWSYCCRNSSVNIQGQPNFYTQATINIHDGMGTVCKNSSPRFLNEPISRLCTGKQYNINPGAVDPDNDELTFDLVNAFQGPNQVVPYNSPYSKTWPFPIINGPALIMDSLTGDVVVTPLNPTTQLTQGTVNMRVMQWGYKDNPVGSGKLRYLKGITHRDIMLASGPCPQNALPYFETQTAAGGKYSICAGEKLCFTVTAKDSDFRPNDPSPVIDSTYMQLTPGNLPAGAFSFVPVYNNTQTRPREDQYEFCWQTTEQDGRGLPYIFAVSASDHRCPKPGKALQSFTIHVLPKDSFITGINAPAGTTYEQSSYEYGVNYIPGVSYEWTANNGTIEGSNTAASVHVKWNAGTAVLKVKQQLNDCVDSASLTIEVEQQVGLDEAALKSLLVKPNPNKGLFSIEGEELTNAHVSVINTLGQTVVEAQKMPSDRTLDVRGLANGVYYLHVSSREGALMLKLVIR